MYMCEYRALFLSVSLGPVSYMRTEAPYLLGYSEPLCFSGPTPAQLQLWFGTRLVTVRSGPDRGLF